MTVCSTVDSTAKLKTIICYDACDHNGDATVEYNEEIVSFLLSCLLQTVWFLLPNVEDFDVSELLDWYKTF